MSNYNKYYNKYMDIIGCDNKIFLAVRFLRTSFSSTKKTYFYELSSSIARCPRRGEEIIITSGRRRNRDKFDETDYRLTSVKPDPYGDSVLRVVAVYKNVDIDDMPYELKTIDEMGSWAIICGYEIVNGDDGEYEEFIEEEPEMKGNFMKNMFGPVGSGMCRLTMDGNIAVKAGGGYKTYNKATGAFVNCDEFVFDIGDEMFFVIPTNSVQAGDIVLIDGKPKYVFEVKPNMLTVLNYENGTVENVMPETHVFMGNTYFYGKIVSMFGNLGVGGSTESIMKYMLMSQMFKGMNGGGNMGGMNPMMLMMMMNGGNGMGDFFTGLFPTPAAPVDEKAGDE